VSRRYNLQRLRSEATFTAKELAVLLRVNIGTVRRWVMKGLKPIDRQVPHLFLGSDVASFLKTHAKSRQPLAPGELYCTPCRAPRKPADGLVRVVPHTATSVTFAGSCPVCGRGLNRHVRIGEIAEKLGAARIAHRDEPVTISGGRHSSQRAPLKEDA
jgi:hypothetical protein